MSFKNNFFSAFFSLGILFPGNSLASIPSWPQPYQCKILFNKFALPTTLVKNYLITADRLGADSFDQLFVPLGGSRTRMHPGIYTQLSPHLEPIVSAHKQGLVLVESAAEAQEITRYLAGQFGLKTVAYWPSQTESLKEQIRNAFQSQSINYVVSADADWINFQAPLVLYLKRTGSLLELVKTLAPILRELTQPIDLVTFWDETKGGRFMHLSQVIEWLREHEIKDSIDLDQRFGRGRSRPRNLHSNLRQYYGYTILELLGMSGRP